MEKCKTILANEKKGGKQLVNNDIKLLARGSGVPLWKIAQALGISEPTLTRRLRRELSEKERSKSQI